MAGSMPREIASGVHVVGLGRGAAASNVYFVRCGGALVLVDAGWGGSAARIVNAAEAVFGTGTCPATILLTHIHPDHSGSAGRLARSWKLRVYVHADELPMAPGKFVPQYSKPRAASPTWCRTLTRGRAYRGCRTGSASTRPGTPRVT